MAKIKSELGEDRSAGGRYDEAAKLFEQLALADAFKELLTTLAYVKPSVYLPDPNPDYGDRMVDIPRRYP